MKKLTTYYLLLIAYFILLISLNSLASLSLWRSGSLLTVYAQNSLDVVFSYDVADEQAEDGDILVTTEKGLVRAKEAFANNLFGVLQKDPVIVLRSLDEKKLPVSRVGVAEVNVTTLNGPISIGDHITSSPIAGKGQKATQSGYVLGTSLMALKEGETITFQNQKLTLAKIPVALRVEYADINSPRSLKRLFDLLLAAFFKNAQTPEKLEQIIRFVAAAVIVIIGFSVGFITLMRSIPKSIEAIGRNPLAKTSIQLSLLINIILAVGITLAGIVAGFIIIRI